MPDLTLDAFTLARIAEDEAAAWGVAHQRWWSRHFRHAVGGTETKGRKDDLTPAEIDEYVRPLVDARVLARCAADRRIVELHAELFTLLGRPSGKCRMCADNEGADYDGAPLLAWPCPTLRLLASVYAEHPDYREEWKP